MNELRCGLGRALHALIIGVTLGGACIADGSSITTGFDLFATQPGASADLSGLGLGLIPVEGVPFGPGNTDTLIERTDEINPFAPPNGSGTVNIELVALHLKSIDPVDLTPLGAPYVGVSADLHLTINKGEVILGLPQPDTLAVSIGRMEARHELGPSSGNDLGGTFDFCFGEQGELGHPGCATLGLSGGGIFTNAIFTTVGGDPSTPGDIILTAVVSKIVQSSTGSDWTHSAPPGDAHDARFGGGSLFAAQVSSVGPFPWRPASKVTAEMVDTLKPPGPGGDLNGDGVAGPGDTLTYNIEIKSFEDLTNFQFVDTIDSNTTLDSASIQVSPVAVDDSYDTPPDTQLDVSDPGQGVLDNDVEFQGDTIGVDTLIDDGGSGFPLVFSSTEGGNVSLAIDGTFTYDPPNGFIGTDTFPYGLIDPGGLTSAGTTSIDVFPPFACDGAAVSGNCWWFGQNGQTCDQVCADHGGYNVATRTYAGSDGTNAQCDQVITALIPFGAINDPSGAENQSGALGCAQDFSGTAFTIRHIGGTTSSASGAGIRRACACNNQPPPVSISYANAPFTLNRGLPVSELPVVSGFVASFSIAPVLPAGLNFNTSTGAITGTPTVNQGSVNYTVTATNAGGSVDTTFSIQVVAFPPTNLSYPGTPFVQTKDVAIVPIVPIVNGQVDSFSISPAAPAGLTFNTGTGVITGTPGNLQSPTNYTVTATNSDGSDMTTISIEIIEGVAACEGVVIGGACWFEGDPGESCDAVCALHGGYNEATRIYAGSIGTDARCNEVLQGLGLSQQSGCTDVLNRSSPGLGCAADFDFGDAGCNSGGGGTIRFFRYTATTTSSGTGGGLPFIHRACACNDQPPPSNLLNEVAPARQLSSELFIARSKFIYCL